MHVVVLGGGMCGLAAGTQLADNGQQVTLLEAQHFLGGLATTLRGETGAGFDFGPHAYHARNKRVLDMFKTIAHDGFPAQQKNVRIKFRGKYYKYPLEAVDLARSMDPFLAAKAFIHYFSEVVRRTVRPRPLVSAEDWVVQAMGRTLYGLFFGPYTEKVWGIPPSQMAASFAQHRIPHISLWKVVTTSLRKGHAKISGTEHRYAPLVIELYYPPKGAGLISERLAERIRAKGGDVRTGALVTGIETTDGRVTAVRYRRVPPTRSDGQLCLLASGIEPGVDPWRRSATPGPEERIECDAVVSSLPLPALFALLGDAVSPDAHAAAQHLRFRALNIVGLRVRKPHVLPAQSVYFQDKTFNRVSETRHYGGTEVCGPDETVVLCDITSEIGDAIWNADPKELGRRCAEELAAEGFLDPADVVESVVLRTTFGYPVYVVGYERAIDTLTAELLRFDNLLTGGRQGLYKYVDMDIASEMGLSMADHLLSGKTKQEAVAAIPYEDRLFA
ncbi:MAG: FAD-dependent oxidoreductase [Chloroflexota bacterium]|nr:FAD-dependent oxidoreductase [Chloroflexota bacterium]MDE3101871.1 FAD-dependent oxidoreductase [Chloroflexota bacterium]